MTSLVHLLVVIILVQSGALVLAVAGLAYALHNRIQIIHQFYRERNKRPNLV
ncbi:MAG TPA: hypothetical protein VJQ82_17245 [Terriglobales bacterium]|nr:hypothetical protein [Terriglobales bacterium]